MRKILLPLLIIVALFISSGQSYEQQSLTQTLEQWLPEKPLEEPLSKLHIPYWGRIISVEENGYYYFLEFLIRKSAHFFTFGFLALTIYWVMPARRYRSTLALLITLVCAIGDEFRQSLTSGRTPYVMDVLLDMAGAITFIIVVNICWKIRNSFKSR